MLLSLARHAVEVSRQSISVPSFFRNFASKSFAAPLCSSSAETDPVSGMNIVLPDIYLHALVSGIAKEVQEGLVDVNDLALRGLITMASLHSSNRVRYFSSLSRRAASARLCSVMSL